MKHKRLKAVIILIAVAILATSTVWAASNTEILKLFFSGNMSQAEPNAKSAYESVANEKYMLTLEEVLADQNRMVFIYSVAGITEEAKTELENREFDGCVTVKLPENPEVRYNLMSQRELEERRTDVKRYYFCTLEELDNPERLPISFSLDIMPEKGIEIPMDTAAEVLELTLTAPSEEDTIIRLSAMDIVIEKNVPEGFEKAPRYTDTYFHMKDGSIKTFNEMFHLMSASNIKADSDSGEPLRMRYTAIARDAAGTSEIRGIIVGDLEYDLNNTTQVKEVQLPENQRPVALKPALNEDAFYLIPLKDAIEKLGGEMAFEQDGKGAVIKYRETVLELWVGKEEYLKNGKPVTIDYGLPVRVMNDGTWAMDGYIFKECLNVDIAWIYEDVDYDLSEDGEQSVLDFVYIIP